MLDKRFFLVLLFSILIVILPFPFGNGSFNVISGLSYCKDYSSCLHETGHRLDWEKNWISSSDSFHSTVMAYMLYGYYERDVLHEILVTNGNLYRYNPFWIPSAEIYATIFEYSGGDRNKIHKMFWEYYDWDRSKKLIEYIKQKSP